MRALEVVAKEDLKVNDGNPYWSQFARPLLPFAFDESCEDQLPRPQYSKILGNPAPCSGMTGLSGGG